VGAPPFALPRLFMSDIFWKQEPFIQVLTGEQEYFESHSSEGAVAKFHASIIFNYFALSSWQFSHLRSLFCLEMLSRM
jgi:hypothetical protein